MEKQNASTSSPKHAQGDRKPEEMTPQDYLRQIKANYPDLKQNLEMKVWVSLSPLLALCRSFFSSPTSYILF